MWGGGRQETAARPKANRGNRAKVMLEEASEILPLLHKCLYSLRKLYRSLVNAYSQVEEVAQDARTGNVVDLVN